MKTIAQALNTLRPGVHCAGTSDLVFDEKITADALDSADTKKKFSGNSVRCRRGHFLYHGTLLYDFPLSQIDRYLKSPPRMPDYRNGRDHEVFVANLNVPADEIRRAMSQTWNAQEPCLDWPREATARLAAEKYSRAEWNESL